MQTQIHKDLAMMPHFAMLPDGELDMLAQQARSETFTRGTELALQGKTRLSHIYVIKRGQISIYDEKDGVRKLGGYIKSGEVFGGITLLMNAGISLRTVLVDEEIEVYLIPQAAFLDLCARYKGFYSFFVSNFSKHISDPGLDSIIGSGQARIFLSGTAPFSFLPEDVLEQAAESLSTAFHPKGSVLFVQGQTKVGYLYILYKGSAERYYEQDGRRIMRDLLGEGDLYGGISMLLKDGLSVRTLEVTEDAYFYLLPKSVFLDICQAHTVFSEFFTDTFGKRMLDKSYAAIIARTTAPPEEGLQLFNGFRHA
jgi:CBS domain-containing protein